MLGEIPVVTFDTSAHNRLVEDGALSEAVLAGLKSGFFFRFAGLSLDELASCPNPAKRAALFTHCGRLQGGQTDCIYPHQELAKRLIVDHFRNPASFAWRKVNVRAWEYENGIRNPEFVHDENLAEAQRRDQLARQKEYDQMFGRLRPELQKIFAAHGEAPPESFRQAIVRLQGGEGNLIWAIGKMLYDRAAETDASEETIKEFIDACPPFRALIYAILMSWYDISLRDRHTGEKFGAGRNDLFMSVYLPYCDKFVTAEKGREQEKCLREIVAVADLKTEIMSYDDFCNSLLIPVQGVRLCCPV